MDNQLTQWDLVSYPGLIVAVVAIVGGLKKLYRSWVDGKEPLLALMFSFVLGVGAKLTIPKAFEGVHWLVFLVTLFFVAIAAGSVHDRIVNPILANKASPGGAK